MASDFTIILPDEPGALAQLGQALGAGGVNIDGFCAITNGCGDAEIHLLIEDAAAVFTTLQEAGIEVSAEQEVAILDVDDRPGVIGEIARTLGDVGVNMSLAYLATNTRLVLAADDLGKALAALEG